MIFLFDLDFQIYDEAIHFNNGKYLAIGYEEGVITFY